jgi:hypothetical protein
MKKGPSIELRELYLSRVDGNTPKKIDLTALNPNLEFTSQF